MKAKQQLCTCTTLFCTFLCRQLHDYPDYPWKCLISRFVKDVNKQWQNSFSTWTWIWLIEIQLQGSSLAFEKSKRVGIIKIETEKMWIDFSLRRFRGCRPSWHLLKTPQYLHKTWPMQEWINTCCKLKLVFLDKFSGRQYFEIRWGFYIKVKVS